jgi:hypothetical protein
MQIGPIIDGICFSRDNGVSLRLFMVIFCSCLERGSGIRKQEFYFNCTVKSKVLPKYRGKEN